MDEINNIFLSLDQGNQLQKKQLKYNRKYNRKYNNKLCEGFASTPDTYTDPDSTYQRKPVFLNNYNRIKADKTTAAADTQELTNLQSQYDDLNSQYKDLIKTAETAGLEYTDLTSKDNPYLSSNITINNSNGELSLASSGIGGYVTSKGVFKNYTDQATFDATAGKNGCPAAAKIIKDVPSNKFSSLLKNGTDMKNGQSCGNEGQNVYVSSLLNDPVVTYGGCYYNTNQDTSTTSTPAMTKASDTKLYTMDECKQYAIDSGKQFFALQGVPDADGRSTCLVGTDSTTIQQYGNASKQVNKIQIWTTEGLIDLTDFIPTSVRLNNKGQLVFSNIDNVEKVLNLNTSTNSESDYYLSLQKSGKLCLYNGTPSGKDGIGGALWCSATTITQLTPNPDWVSSNGKYSDSFLSSSSSQILFQNEWIGSADGALKLIMLPSGNLVLYTSTISNGCIMKIRPSVSGYGINNNINAVFQLNEVGVPENLGNMAYIDNNSVAFKYPNEMLSYTKGVDSKYNMYNNFDSPDESSNIIGGGPMNAIGDCQVACNSTDGCAGFVWVNTGDDSNMCYLKNSSMFPKSPRISNNNRTMGVRIPAINNGNICNKNIEEIDTIRYSNYVKNNTGMSPETSDEICKNRIIPEANKIKMDEIKAKMNQIEASISKKIKELYANDQTIFDTMNLNDETLKKKISSYKNIVMGKKNNLQSMGQNLKNDQNLKANSQLTTEGMQNIDMSDVNGMLADTDIRILQENYSYIFWSVLAVGLLTITVNVMKQNKK